MKTLQNENPKTLILGIGNTLLGDEGIGVAVVNELEKTSLPANVETLDGGTGSFLLLEPMQAAEKIILIDATIDGAKPGTIRRLCPKFSKDYPKTLTAHDIGLKDLLDAFYLLGDAPPDVTLFAVSILPWQEMRVELSPAIQEKIKQLIGLVKSEITLCERSNISDK